MKKTIALVSGAAVILACATAGAVTPRSVNYSLEYVAVGMGGGSSSSSDYSMVAYADESYSASRAESVSYSMAPAVGGITPKAASASAEDWQLY